jgi:hypothetical protein
VSRSDHPHERDQHLVALRRQFLDRPPASACTPSMIRAQSSSVSSGILIDAHQPSNTG